VDHGTAAGMDWRCTPLSVTYGIMINFNCIICYLLRDEFDESVILVANSFKKAVRIACPRILDPIYTRARALI
jgi:hypothetical protein